MWEPQLELLCPFGGKEDRTVYRADSHGRISVTGSFNGEPVGTNLMDREQARELFNWLGVWLHRV